MQFIFISHTNELKIFLDFLWSGDDQAIFSGIISFYFGQRAMLKRMTQGK
jgi:hypothetical protein